MARRNKGEGSIHRLEGRRGFRAQVTLRDGSRRTKQFPTQRAAAAWIRDIEIRHHHDEDASVHEFWTVVLVLGAAGLVTLTGLYGVLGAIP